MEEIKNLLESDRTKAYRPIPFWSWNDALTKEKLLSQVEWMDANQIGGYFMHARSGLNTEYLSKEWMECIRACAREAKKRGMEGWIYDENGWPSGFAGGKVIEEERFRDQYIEKKEGVLDPDATVSYRIMEEKLIRVSKAEGTFAGAEKPESADGENLSGKTGEEQELYLNLYIRRAVSTADILNPEAVDRFIELTHEQYKNYFGEAFADEVAGFFTDEPQYQRWDTPYTDQIASYFKETYQEDILDSLGLLFVEKEGYKSFRYRYWKGMQHLMLTNFSEKIYQWCEDNHVRFTGHYVEESTMGLQLMCCGGIMPFYEFEHIPGIDWLGKDTSTELAAVQLASTASQLGKKQRLTETFGCCGWDVTPRELRRIAGFQYVNGVNLMCHHLIPYSERGTRKYDYPAHYSDVNPWVAESFGEFNTYFTRLGCLLGEGKQQVNVAMLHPIRSAYFDYKRNEDYFGILSLEESFTKSYQLLGRHGIAYHFLDETLLEKYGFVEGTRIGCGQCSYEYLVLPRLYTMDHTTEQLIHTYVENGGKILLLDENPFDLEGEEFDYSYLVSNCTLEEIAAAQPYQVRHQGIPVYSTYRKLGKTEFLYVINASATESFTQEFLFDRKVHSFHKVDLSDLTTREVPLAITLKPGEDAFLILSDKEVPEETPKKTIELRFQNAGIAFQENVLVVDHVRFSRDGVQYSKPWPHSALFQKLIKDRYEGTLFLQYEFEILKLPKQLMLEAEANRERRVWLNGTELKTQTAGRDSYLKQYDITQYARCGRNTYTVEVDWHEDESVYFALFGENVTESLKNCIVYDSELQPIFLKGRFGVYPKTGYTWTQKGFVEGNDFYIGAVPEHVNNLTIDGFPFLAGKVTLSQELYLEDPDVVLKIAGDYQMAELSVNGTKLDKLLFRREADISGAACAGKNRISATFWISNRNMYGPHHWTADKNSGVGPYSFDLSGTWTEDQSDAYHDSYDLKLFYPM